MVKNKFFMLILGAWLLAACVPSPQSIQTAVAQTQAVWTLIPTQTHYPTQTPYPTQTAVPTIAITVVITKIVTPTFTFTPIFTLDPLRAPEGDGTYIVGVNIAPGVWRNDSKSDSCYWELITKTNNLITNYYGLGGGVAYIRTTAFLFRSERCGTWTFLYSP